MAHLGVTWGRRMLAPPWREVWGEGLHPVDPADRTPGEVTKALVLLSDGENGAGDRADTLPGRLYVSVEGDRLRTWRTSADCNRAPDCLRLGGRDASSTPPYASGYSALGRFGDGDAMYGGRMGWARDRRTRADAVAGLDELMLDSCSLAREEGLSVYTVSMNLDQEFNDKLIECSGTAQTSERERVEFHFRGDDPSTIVTAFREIGQRLLKVRRSR